MTEEEKLEHARRLIMAHNDEYEYCNVYEDFELEDEDVDTWEDILHLMYEAKLTISW